MLGGCFLGTSGNNAPSANAGADQVANAGASVTLDGSASNDPNGKAISFSWKQTLGTPVSLTSTSAPKVTFTVPAKGTTLRFELTVSNGQSSSVATVNVSVRPVAQSVHVKEMSQRSITEDRAAMGNFPNDWLVADAGAHLPQTPSDDSEIPEFIERFKNTRVPRIIEEDLAPGATRAVSLQLTGPSGLAGLAQWIGTTKPLGVTIALDGSTLVTGTTYHLGTDRGGSYLHAQAAAGGLATMSVTNRADVTVKVRIIFAATAL